MSLKNKAHLAGLLYLIVILTGAFAEAFVRERMIVSGDAAATAANILASHMLFRMGLIADLANLVAGAGVAVILYELLSPINRTVARFALYMVLLANATMATYELLHFLPLMFLRGKGLPAFGPHQLEALSLFALRAFEAGYSISLIFFAFYCMANGYLISRAAFLPRILGPLLMLAGVCYLTNSIVNFLPPLSVSLFPYILLPSLLAEGSLTLWLLFKGIDEARWREQAG
jgi:hypothetical protein